MFWSSFLTNTWKQFLRAVYLRGWLAMKLLLWVWSCFLVSVYFQQCSPREGQNGTTSSVIKQAWHYLITIADCVRWRTRCWCYIVGSSQISSHQHKAIYFHRDLGDLYYSAPVHCTVNTMCGSCLYKQTSTNVPAVRISRLLISCSWQLKTRISAMLVRDTMQAKLWRCTHNQRRRQVWAADYRVGCLQYIVPSQT